MIILKHLTVEGFRLLREINLRFPQRGSILIQGPNEAGKTALLESIYFALYGEPLTPLASNHHKPTLDDLLLYGASQARVSLTLSIGATTLLITRSIERGASGAEQQISVEVRRLGMPAEEPITHLATANESIIAELGRMDGETLRTSCIYEKNIINQQHRWYTNLDKIISAYDDIAEAQRELPELERQIAELDRREREELPALEKRVNDLADLSRSFGTLERMSNDLLTSVSTIKQLAQERKQYQELQSDDDELDEEIIRARLQVDQVRQSLHELEERRRAGRPQLEARLQRFQKLCGRIAAVNKA